MEYRTGKCSQCGAEYKVPASFAHNAARCQVCKGVVHLGPPPPRASAPDPGAGAGASAPAIPAKRVVPKAPAPSSEPQPAPSRPAVPGERSATPASRVRPAAQAAGTGTGSSSPAAERSADPGRRRPEHHGQKPAKKASRAGLLSVAGLVVAALLFFLFRDQLFGTTAPPETAAAAPPREPAATESATEPVRDADEEPEAPAAPVEPETRTTKTDPAGSGALAVELASAPEPGLAETAAKKGDPSSIDLAAIPDFLATPDTTPDEWSQLNAQVDQWMDPEAGAASNRARLQVLQKKRKAVPAILNHFKKLDFSIKEGRSNGDQCQKALMEICNGTNFDWRYADEAAGRPFTHPEDVWYCKRVVQLWTDSWRKSEQDIDVWIKLAKLDAKDPAEAKHLREQFGKTPVESASNDDLDVD